METKLDKKILAKLSSKKPEEREAAKAALKLMEKDTLRDQLVEHLRSEAQKRRRNQRCTRICLYIYLSIIGTILLVYVGKGLLTGSWSHFPKGLFNQFSIFSAFGAAAAASASSKNGSKLLAQEYGEDVRIVGPLAEALEMKDKDLQADAEAVLIKQLPHMRASDAKLLDDDQRAILRRAIKGDNINLVLAILKAWEQIGDSKAIPDVEQLANGGYKVGKETKVQAAAKDCLPHLRILAEQERASQLLVRAAESPADPSQVLLRPAHDVGDNNPDRLVRATDVPAEQQLTQQE